MESNPGLDAPQKGLDAQLDVYQLLCLSICDF